MKRQFKVDPLEQIKFMCQDCETDFLYPNDLKVVLFESWRKQGRQRLIVGLCPECWNRSLCDLCADTLNPASVPQQAKATHIYNDSDESKQLPFRLCSDCANDYEGDKYLQKIA